MQNLLQTEGLHLTSNMQLIDYINPTGYTANFALSLYHFQPSQIIQTIPLPLQHFLKEGDQTMIVEVKYGKCLIFFAIIGFF